MLKLQTDVGQTFMYTDNMYSHENVTETIGKEQKFLGF